MKRLLVATSNEGKAQEMRDLLSGLPFRVVTPREIGCEIEVAETGASFEENAMIKAAAYFEATGIASVADDSGLEVDALGGVPGIRSARFAGPSATDAHNRAKLLRLLSGRLDRTARFKAAIALVDGARKRIFTGVCEGRIAQHERGTAGFGYDPVFIPGGESRTFAEMSKSEKNRISHRAMAMAALTEDLTETSTTAQRER